MKRIPASLRLRKQLEELLQGVKEYRFLLGEFLRLAAALLLQEALEQEASDFLGRGHYKRREEGQQGYRNGHEPMKINTAEGKIKVYKPQLRNTDRPFCSRLSAFFKQNTKVLQKLAVEMEARGLSTRDIEDVLGEAIGERILSRTAVSNLTEILFREFEEFRNRDLSGFEIQYLFLAPSTRP